MRVTENNDAFHFNEPENLYRIKVVTLVCDKLRVSVSRSEENAFKEVIAGEVDSLAEQGDYPPPGTLHKRMNDYLWFIWRGFNSEEPKNMALAWIVNIYANMRLGIIPCRWDEAGTIAEAIIDDYVDQNQAGKEILMKRPGKDWLLPIIHLVNFHMKAFTKIPPIPLSNLAEEDKKIHKSHRKHNTCVIKVNFCSKVQDAAIERR